MNRGHMGYSTVSLPGSSTSSGYRRAPKQEPGIGDVLGGAFVSVPLVLLYLLGMLCYVSIYYTSTDIQNPHKLLVFSGHHDERVVPSLGQVTGGWPKTFHNRVLTTIGTFIWQQLITYPEDTTHHKAGDMLSFADSWYFTVVTFTTVGYGDYLPVSQGAKRFFMFWCILSSLINFTVVSKFLSSVLVYKPSPEDNVDCENCGRPQLHHASKFFHVWPRLASVLRWIVVLIMLLILGSYLIRDTYWTQTGRRLDWVDCWYWSFATLTTVGYGDLFPQHQKVLFSFFFLVCVTVFCTVLAEVAGIVVDLDRFGRMEKLLAKGFSKELMDVIDTNHDGVVSKLEFMMYVLDHLSIADMGEMKAICKVFDALDHHGEGVLYMQQARGRLQRTNIDPRFLYSAHLYATGPLNSAGIQSPQNPIQQAPRPQRVVYAAQPPRKTGPARPHYAPPRNVPSHQEPLLDPEASAPPAPAGPGGRGVSPRGPALQAPVQQPHARQQPIQQTLAPQQQPAHQPRAHQQPVQQTQTRSAPPRMVQQAPPRPDQYR